MHFLTCIQAAHRTGFLRYAAALHTLFAMEYPAAPKFTTVTGRDFGRAIAWARRQPPGPLSNTALRDAVRESAQRAALPAPCSESTQVSGFRSQVSS